MEQLLPIHNKHQCLNHYYHFLCLLWKHLIRSQSLVECFIAGLKQEYGHGVAKLFIFFPKHHDIGKKTRFHFKKLKKTVLLNYTLS